MISLLSPALACGLAAAAFGAQAAPIVGDAARAQGSGAQRAENGAVFVSQTPPPANMSPGQTATVTVRMRNTGRNAWTAADGYKLGAVNPLDNQFWRKGRVPLAAKTRVKTGGTVTLRFTVTAPSRAGKYTFQWRMVQERREWFGQLSPLLEIEVSGSTAAAQGGWPCQAPLGWNQEKWAHTGHRTPKYVVGRILSKHPHTPEGLRRALPEIQSYLPGAQILSGKGDRLRLPEVGTLDVIRDAGSGGRAWQWLELQNECCVKVIPAAAGFPACSSGAGPADP